MLLKARPRLRAGAVAGMAAAACAVPASAALAAPSPEVSTSWCANPLISQVFRTYNDNRWYASPGGETADDFSGAGWTLTGGARVVSATLADGRVGHVLDLPAGSSAASPLMCVTSDYPVARAVVRLLSGGDGVNFGVSYAGTPTWQKPKNTGKMSAPKNGWKLSGNLNTQVPDHTTGWQLVYFTLSPGGSKNEFQVYDFYVDPYSKG